MLLISPKRQGILALIVFFSLAPTGFAQVSASGLDESAPEAAANSNVAAPEVSAGKLKPGEGTISYRLSFFDVGDSGSGNPFIDESLTVIEPVIVFDHQLTEKTGITGTLSYDLVSSASIERLSNYSGQSGASGDNYIGLDLGVRYAYSPKTDLSAHASFSTEYDYNSLGAGAAISRESADGDSRLTYSFDAFFDSLDLIRGTAASQANSDGTDNRTSYAATAKWYQIISPKSHGEFGLTLAQQTGFLSTPYNFVVDESKPTPGATFPYENGAQGSDINEVLPDSRTRIALYGRVRNSLGPGRSWELGGRIYQDDWGISSFSIEPAYEAAISSKWRIRPRYRYYNQTAADAFFESYNGEAVAELTQDSDLGAFNSNLFGVKFLKRNSAKSSMDVSLDYILRSDGLDQLVFSIGWARGY
ncbi:MAG: hypothetical protein ACI8TQ_002934 [Planctomycetota bacterium]